MIAYTIGRVAILTQPHNGRGQCHYCGPCQRGCSVGAYFSSQSSTLPAANKTGLLTLLPDRLVESLEYDEDSKKVTAVNVIDCNSRTREQYRSKLVFLCASTIATAQILLNSKSNRFPNGLGNDSDQVGRNLMDHTMSVFASAYFDGMDDFNEFGQRPTGVYIPRFKNLKDTDQPFTRGYGFQGSAKRENWKTMLANTDGFGAEFKSTLSKPGRWKMTLAGLGECLPNENNRVTLSKDKVDRFGIPQVQINFEYQKNEELMLEDIAVEAEAMLKAANGKDINVQLQPPHPGRTIHEMGTARMGNDPATSVLNKWNQMHSVPNVFITDGSCMTSSACVNPSLTYMALTARAVDYAVKQIASL